VQVSRGRQKGSHVLALGRSQGGHVVPESIVTNGSSAAAVKAGAYVGAAQALGIAARRGGRRAYCGLVRLGPRADGATEADTAEVTNPPAKEEDTEGGAKASSVKGRPKETAKADGGEAAKTPAPEDASARDAEETPNSPVAAVAEKGIVLTGGGALLRNLDKLLSIETGVPAYVADDPLTCVAIGAGRALEHFAIFRDSLTPV